MLFTFGIFLADGAGDEFESKLAAGTEALKSGKRAVAEALFQDAVFLGPKDSRGYQLLAELLLERNAADGVLQLCEQMRRHLPNSYLPDFWSGRAWQVKGEARKAILSFEQGVKKTPGHADSWFALGNLYESSGSPVEKTTLALATYIERTDRRDDRIYEAERKLRKLLPQLLSWRQSKEMFSNLYGRALIEAGLAGYGNDSKAEGERDERPVSAEIDKQEHLRRETERVLLVRDGLGLLRGELNSVGIYPKTTDTDLIRRVLDFYLDEAWSQDTPAEVRPMLYEDALKFCRMVKGLDLADSTLQKSLRLTSALALYLSKAYPLAHEVLARAEPEPADRAEKGEHLLENRIERSLYTLMKTRGFHRYIDLGARKFSNLSLLHYRIEGELDSHQVWEEEAWLEVSAESGLGRMFALVSVPGNDGPRNWFLYARTVGNEEVIGKYGSNAPDNYQVEDEILRSLIDARKNYAPVEFETVINDLDEKLRDVEQSISELEARPPSMSPMDLVGDGTAFLATQLARMLPPEAYVRPVRLEALLPNDQAGELRKVNMLPIQTRDGWVKVHYQWDSDLLHITKVESE